MEDLGYKQLVKEVLNKEYNLDLEEDIKTNFGLFYLIDFDKEFVVDINNILITQKKTAEISKIIIEFSSNFKKPTIVFVFSSILLNVDLEYTKSLRKTFLNDGVSIRILDFRKVIDLAMGHDINFMQYIEDLIGRDSSIQRLVYLDHYLNYTQSFNQSSQGNPRKKSIKGVEDNPNQQRVTLKKKSRFDSTEYPINSKELLKYNYFFVRVNWSAEGDQRQRFLSDSFWELDNNWLPGALGLVKKGSILLGITPILSQHGNEAGYQIDAIGYSLRNYQNQNTLDVTWRRVSSPDFYRDEIARNMSVSVGEISNRKITFLLQGISLKIKFPIEDIIAQLKAKEETLLAQESSEEVEIIQKEIIEETPENITRLAGIQSDSDDGTDYLDIENDVLAFARVMCAENFKPPLAIGLLGKWGSGKSFFMRELQKKVELLSGNDDQNIYCKGIAEVHFNAWSYMDANLWAGIVTKIFERLNLYIKDEKISDAEKDKIKAEIAKKLSITSETIDSLEKEKEDLTTKIGTLTTTREELVTKIDTNIETIRESTLVDVLKQINISFNIEENIDTAIKKNKSYVKTKEQLAALIPTEHWKDPINIYQELKSNRTLFRQFFMKETWRKNWSWLLFIAAIIILTPIGFAILSHYIENFDFTIPEELWYTLSSISAVLLGVFRSYKKLSPLIASFWKIKNEYSKKIEDYEQKKEVAIFEFEQNEKALKLEIEDSRAKIQQIDQDIEQSKELEKSLEDRINKTLSTETLYNFIEKKALSNDYKQYLGIVSIIRKDFEILSELFADSRDEKEEPKTEKEKKKHKEIVSFRKRFEKPLERIILYVDDLDRCDEKRVVEVLEAVNLLMAFPLFIVVVGVDPRWVKIALEAKYQKQFTLNTEEEGLRVSPSNYLEKIFQIPFRLKSAEDRTVKSMLKSLAEKKVSLASQGETAISTTPENPSDDHLDGKMTGTKTIVTLEEPDDKNITIDNPHETPDQGNIAEIEIVEEPEKTEQKEKIKSLEFSKKEVELIQNMSCVIGSNPRAIKRFVNIYRVIKAHDIFNYNPDNQNHEILADLFLIALPLGTFRSLAPTFLDFLSENRNYSIKTYLNRSVPKQANAAQTKEYEIRKALLQELNKKGIPILEIKKNHFNNEHTNFIKRFYFN